MTERPDCLSRDACQARTPGKHCRRCALTALNKRPEKRSASARNMARMRSDPAFVEKLDRSADKRNAAIRAHHADPRVRQIMRVVSERGRAASLISRTGLTYIPAEYRDLYRDLVRRRCMSAKDARAAIEEQRRIDARRVIRQREAEQRARHERQLAEQY